MNILNVVTKDKTYPIYIERGIISKSAEIIKDLYSGKRIGIVSDSNVNGIYGDGFSKALEDEGFEPFTVEVEPGEKSKSLSVYERVCTQLLEGGITRSDMIIALGGGVIGDLAGFAAATLLRGVRFIQVPTSLVAQIDSSVGGKVAVNLEIGKNLIGSFYQPEAVIIDPDVLSTLEDRFFSDGMAEVIKYACIKDRELFEKLEKLDTVSVKECMDYIIMTCCAIKRDIVQIDEKDRGERMLLNFGHTFGHVVEKYFEYSKYTHGEGVGLGMVHIAKKGEEMGLVAPGTSDSIRDILERYNLPVEYPQMESSAVEDTLRLDKKSSSNDINLIMIEEIGKGYIKKIRKSNLQQFI